MTRHILRLHGRVLMIACLVAVALACSSRTVPKALPPQTMAPTPPETEEPITNAGESLGQAAAIEEPLATGIEVEEESPATSSQAPSTGGEDPTTVVLDPGEDDSEQPQSLFAASQAEKQRREEAGESKIVLTNKNLKEYSKGQLTFVEGDEASMGGEVTDREGVVAGEEEDEEYWRNRVLEIRLGWRESIDLITELESEVARLRREFYAEDDPFYRDSQIKPAWDEALEDLEQAKRDARQAQLDLERTMDQGHRAGALPGWLREGVEIEPTAEELEELELVPQDNEKEGIHEPSEPVILDEDGNGG
jgi:hypothetical protein